MGNQREALLADLAEYWIERELCFVETPQQIGQSLSNFNREAPTHRSFILPLVQRYFRHWVYDPLAGVFGPNKFVGFQHMTMSEYQLAGTLSRLGLDKEDRFDGRWTGRAIREALEADYAPDQELPAALERWASVLFGCSDVFGSRDRAVWKFVRLDTQQ